MLLLLLLLCCEAFRTFPNIHALEAVDYSVNTLPLNHVTVLLLKSDTNSSTMVFVRTKDAAQKLLMKVSRGKKEPNLVGTSRKCYLKRNTSQRRLVHGNSSSLSGRRNMKARRRANQSFIDKVFNVSTIRKVKLRENKARYERSLKRNRRRNLKKHTKRILSYSNKCYLKLFKKRNMASTNRSSSKVLLRNEKKEAPMKIYRTERYDNSSGSTNLKFITRFRFPSSATSQYQKKLLLKNQRKKSYVNKSDHKLFLRKQTARRKKTRNNSKTNKRRLRFTKLKEEITRTNDSDNITISNDLVQSNNLSTFLFQLLVLLLTMGIILSVNARTGSHINPSSLMSTHLQNITKDNSPKKTANIQTCKSQSGEQQQEDHNMAALSLAQLQQSHLADDPSTPSHHSSNPNTTNASCSRMVTRAMAAAMSRSTKKAGGGGMVRREAHHLVDRM